MFKVNKKDSKATHSCVFIVKFEHIYFINLWFLLLTLNMYIPASERRLELITSAKDIKLTETVLVFSLYLYLLQASNFKLLRDIMGKTTVFSNIIQNIIQKQLFTDNLRNRYSQKFRNIHRKTPVLESVFSKVAITVNC